MGTTDDRIYDVEISGGGPSGLSATPSLARERRNVIVGGGAPRNPQVQVSESAANGARVAMTINTEMASAYEGRAMADIRSPVHPRWRSSTRATGRIAGAPASLGP